MEKCYFRSSSFNKVKKGLVIYDISDDKKRRKLAACLEGYGVRVQESAFEFFLDKTCYFKMLNEIQKYAERNDSIRVYPLHGEDEIINYGKAEEHGMVNVYIC